MVIELSSERIQRDGESIAEIRRATRTLQNRLEMLTDFQHRATDPELYRALLEKLFGFFVQIEFRLDSAPTPLTLDVRERRKSSDLLMDIISLGTKKEFLGNVPMCDALPDIQTPDQTLGAVYVLEQTLIGGQFMCQILQQRLGVTPARGCRFFNGYGAKTRCMWRKLIRTLDEQALASGSAEGMIRAATETYERLINWLENEQAEGTHSRPCLCLR